MDKVETSRRSFIKGSALATAGIVFGASFVGMSGCTDEAGQPQSDEGVERDVFLHETDVLVVGGGCAGTNAARRASMLGQRTTILDKGKFGHSATSGINWGQVITTAEFTADGGEKALWGAIRDYNGLIDQNWAHAVVQASINGKIATSNEQLGVCLQRNPDGSVKGLESDDVPVNNLAENRVRVAAQYLQRTGCEIYQYFYALDVLVDGDGHVAGVVAIDITTGDPHVFRAKTVIMATGGYAYATGRSSSGPETTGIGQKIFFEHGFEMMNMELFNVDLQGWQPFGTKHEDGSVETTANCGILNGEMYDTIYNGNYELFVVDHFASEEAPEFTTLFAAVPLLSMSEIMAGRGTENNGIYLKQTDIANRQDLSYGEFIYAATGDSTKRIGYEMPEYQETVVNTCSTAGGPVSLTENMETVIPGLYSNLQSCLGWGAMTGHGQGWISGTAAAEAATALEALPQISWDDVQVILDHTYGLLESEPSDPIRSVHIYDDIRSATRNGLMYPTDGTKIQTCIDELKRIQSEDLPKMYCASKSPVFNLDWINALDAEVMLRVMTPAAEAALMREESRPDFVRSDFPVEDNENWLKNIVVTFKDGEYSYEVRDVVDTYYSVDELKEMLPTIDLTPV